MGLVAMYSSVFVFRPSIVMPFFMRVLASSLVATEITIEEYVFPSRDWLEVSHLGAVTKVAELLNVSISCLRSTIPC